MVGTKNIEMIIEFMKILEDASDDSRNKVCAHFIECCDHEIKTSINQDKTIKEFEIAINLRVKFVDRNGIFRATIMCVGNEEQSERPSLDYACKYCQKSQYNIPRKEQWIMFHELYNRYWLAMKINTIIGCEDKYIIVSDEVILVDSENSVLELAAQNLLAQINHNDDSSHH